MRQVLPFDWLTTDHLVSGESTLHQVAGYELWVTLLSLIENFSAYLQPSHSRLYSAAASPSECLYLGGSLAISYQDNFYSLKFLGHREKSHHSHIIHQANHQTQKTMNTWSEIFQEYLLCCDESTKIRMCKQATKPQTINLMMKA